MNNINWKELLKKCFGKEKNERYHAVSMLTIYGIFFAILIVFVRMSPTTSDNNQPTTNNGSNNSTVVEKDEVKDPTNNIVDNDKDEEEVDINETFEINYSYVYTVENNGVKEIFTGKRLDDKEIFTHINANGSSDYAKLSGNYLKKEDGEYKLVDEPSTNLEYLDIDKVITLTEKASFTQEGNLYKYVVPTKEVLSIYGYEQMISDASDSIIISLENGLIKTIDIDFSNYSYVINGNVSTKLTIKMEFNNVGTTENFNVTVGD